MSFRAYYALQETKRGVQFTGMIFQTRSGKDRFVIVKISGGTVMRRKKAACAQPAADGVSGNAGYFFMR